MNGEFIAERYPRLGNSGSPARFSVQRHADGMEINFQIIMQPFCHFEEIQLLCHSERSEESLR